MNRSSRNVYFLLIAAAAILTTSGCGNVEGRSRGKSQAVAATITRTWPAAEIRELRVFEVDGSVDIQAVDTNEISLVATARGDFEIKKGQENDGLFETAIEGNTLYVGRREKKHERDWNFTFIFGDDDRRIDYVLRIPASVALDLKTVNGRIQTRGGEGETQVSTVNGPIDIELAGNREVRATTVNGSVRAKFTRDFAGARFKTVNGGVEATLPKTASFAVDLSQVNGDFEAAFPLSIHSNPGSRRVSGEVNGGAHALKIVTVNGDVELARMNGIE